MKKEAATSAQDFARQRAEAKSVSDAEAAELQRFLEDTEAALAQQQKLTSQLEAEARRLKDELKASMAARDELVRNNQGLTQVTGQTCTSVQ